MKKLLSIVLVAILLTSLTIPLYATAETIAETTIVTEPVTVPETALVTEAATTLEAVVTTVTEPVTEPITIPATTAETPYTYPPIENIIVTEPAETTATITLEDLAKFLASKSNISIDEAYEVANNMLTVADEYFGTNDTISRLIVTMKQNPIILVLLIIILSLFSGATALYLKSRFINSSTTKTLMNEYIEPSKNSFSATATSIQGMEKTLASYSNTIDKAAALAAQSESTTAQLKSLSTQNIEAEQKRKAAYKAYTKAMELNSTMLNTLMQNVNIPSGRKDEIAEMYCKAVKEIRSIAEVENE